MSDIVGPSETTTGATNVHVVNFYPDVITASVFASAADAAAEIQCKFTLDFNQFVESVGGMGGVGGGGCR